MYYKSGNDEMHETDIPSYFFDIILLLNYIPKIAFIPKKNSNTFLWMLQWDPWLLILLINW